MSYSPTPGQHNPFNPYRGYPLPVFGNPFVQQPPPYHGQPASLPPMRPIPRPTPQEHQAPLAPRPTAPPTPPPGIPYIGARISLISNMNIRYEGTLYTIDPKEATVALQSVRCFGTEGRVPPSEEVAPSPHSYQFIIFRGKDIKDLHVCEAPVPRYHPSQPPPPQDPAIVATGTVSSPFGTPIGLGSFNKPELKQTELEKPTEERFRLGPESSETSKDKVTWETPSGIAPTQPQSTTRSEPVNESKPISTTTGHSRTPPKSSTQTKQASPSAPVQQGPKQKKSPSDQSKNQYKPKPQAHRESNQSYQKQGARASQQNQGQDRNRKPREKGPAFYSGPQKKQDKKPKNQTSGRQNQQTKRDDDSTQSQGASGNINYDGPGTGSYLGRRVGNPTIAPAIPQGEFDIQSSNARFDKDRFKEQVLKVATQKVKGADGETTNSETPASSTNEGESAELSDLFKKLKNGSEKSASTSLSPSAIPFVPAAEGKKETKEKESIDGVPTSDNIPTAPKYEKKNFYDDISTDRDVSQRRDMVKKDTETFGDIAANYGYYNRQRPRYFNNGGRGRGRGGSWRGGGGAGGGSYGGGGVLNGGSGAHYRAVQRI